MHVVYLHGFLSSSQAFKAQQLRQYIESQSLAITFHCPDLPNKPSQALLFIEDFLQGLSGEPFVLVGSSLGGFYAQIFSAKFSCKAVLINPVVNIGERLEGYLGNHKNPYSQECFAITCDDIEAVTCAQKHVKNDPHQLMVLLQMADEVLDAALASAYFYASKCIIEPQGEHQFQAFERYLPLVCQWLLQNLDNSKALPLR